MIRNSRIPFKDGSGINKSENLTRRILPILVHRVLNMDNPTITYGDLAQKLEISHSRAALNLRFPLDYIGETLCQMKGVPPIQGLVVNQETGMPGDSVIFLRNVDPEKKGEIVKQKWKEIRKYQNWLDVLEKFGLSLL